MQSDEMVEKVRSLSLFLLLHSFFPEEIIVVSENTRIFVPHTIKNADIFAQFLRRTATSNEIYEQNQIHIGAVLGRRLQP